jgi:hypothetical protein
LLLFESFLQGVSLGWQGAHSARAAAGMRLRQGYGAQGGLPALPFPSPSLTQHIFLHFPLDPLSLYANLMRVTIGRTGRDGSGMKTGSPSIADCLPSVLSSEGPAEVEGPADLTQRRKGTARPAATKEIEQEQTEKTEAEKLCQKCATFRYSTTARPAATKGNEPRISVE